MAEAELYSGRYEIMRHIARGGMAEVYLARDHLLDRPVALKVLFPEYARDESFVERFRREAKAAANLNHPNIVAVYDWGEEEGTYFIVMEYVEGQSLRDLLRDEGALLPQRAAEIAADVAAALGYAHRHGVVHRDVKPGNILITPQGQVKVTDFGIARAGTSEHLTRTGMVMGTAAYFSPEQAQGQTVDPRSDVYSLGVVLYESVTAEPPFSGDDPVSIAYQHVREEPMPPGIKNPDVPVDLERVILTALTKAPGDRYASAEDMRDDLVRFARGLPVASRPVTAVLDEAAATTTVAPRVDATAVGPAVPGDGGPPTPVPEPDRRNWAFIAVLIALILLIVGLAVLLARSLGLFENVPSVAVPDVVGMQLEEARDELEGEGFEVETEFEENDIVPENEVFGQDPEGGARADEGSTVTLTVSQGAGMVPVPNVVDMQAGDAREELEEAGFEVTEREEFSDDVDDGRVIRTEPEAGGQAPRGSTVTMYVSSGVEQRVVPDVQGKDAVTAAAELAGAGFQVETARESSSDVPEDQVIRTEPPGGTQAERGSTVRMVVSSGPPPVTVPGVIGQTESDAEKAIKDAGLRVAKTTTSTCDLSEEGRVVDQTPDGGTEVDRDSTVTIVICRFAGDTGGGGGGGNGGGGDGGGGDGGGGDGGGGAAITPGEV